MKKNNLFVLPVIMLCFALSGCFGEATTETVNTTTVETQTETPIDYSSIASDIYSQVYDEIRDNIYDELKSEIIEEYLEGGVDIDYLQDKISDTVEKARSYNCFITNYSESGQSVGSGVVYLKEENEAGSEYLYTYYVITNQHVVEKEDGDPERLTLCFEDEYTVYELTKVGEDSSIDLALVKFESSLVYPTVELADIDDVSVGDVVIACGNPDGYSLYSSVTMGIVSGLDRHCVDSDGVTNSRKSYIQTDAAINPGNSGGALYNLEGKLIGINTLKYFYENNVTTGRPLEGLGFAIPVDVVEEVITEIKEYGSYAGTVMLGIQCVEVQKAIQLNNYYTSMGVAAPYTIPSGVTKGIYVSAVTEGGSCWDTTTNSALLNEGDIVTKIDDTVINGTSDVSSALSNYRVGDTAVLTVIRNGETTTVTITFKR